MSKEDPFVKTAKEMFEKYNIDPEKPLYDENEHVKPIPTEWKETVIQMCIDKTSSQIKPKDILKNLPNKIVILEFDSQHDLFEFNKLLAMNILPTLNYYIQEIKNENPKNYHRAIIYESREDNTKLIINY